MEARKGQSHKFRRSLSFRKVSKALTQHGRAKKTHTCKEKDSESQNHEAQDLDDSLTVSKKGFDYFTDMKRSKPFRRSVSSKLQYLPRLGKKFMNAAGTETQRMSGITRNRNGEMNINLRRIGLNKRKDLFKQVKSKFRSLGEVKDKNSCGKSFNTHHYNEFETANHTDDKFKRLNRNLRHYKKCNSTVMRMILKSRLTSLSEEVDFRDLIKPVAFHTQMIKVPKNKVEIHTELPSEITEENIDKNRAHDRMNGSGVLYKDNGVVAIADCTTDSQNIVSPTCADIYGQDEGLDLSFSLSHDRMVSASDQEVNSCLETSKGSESEAGTLKRNNDYTCTDNLQFGIMDRKNNTKINQDTHVNRSDQKCERINSNNVPGAKEDKIVYDFTDILKKKKSLQSRNTITQNDEMFVGYDEVDNPWVLRTDILKVSQKKQEPNLKSINFVSEYSVDDSIGFGVNQWNQSDGKPTESYCNMHKAGSGQLSRLVRSDSVESVNSFSSSIHSAHSEDLFFSASEPEMEPDQISISSTESMTGNKPKCELKIEENNDENCSHVHEEGNALKTTNSKYETELSTNDLDKVENSSVPTPRKISSYLTGLKYFSFESADKNKASKHEKLKQRRSLDSNLKIQQMSLDLNMNESPAFKSKLTSSTDSGLNSTLSPVQEKHNKPLKTNRRCTVDVTDDQDHGRFYTLPVRRKVKSEINESPKRRVTRISSISKMLSDKAQSLSNIKLGSSFKLRNNDSEKGKVPFMKATSLTNLMARKGAEMASSISTLIRGRSNSNTVVDSPFKQNEKPKKTNNDDKVEIHYEKIKIPCPRKRPVTSEEITAWKKRLTLNIALANPLSSSETMRLRADSVARKPDSSGSDKGAIRSPTLLDEIMKSVDNSHFRPFGSVVDYEFEDTDDEDSSNESTSVVFGNQITASSDPSSSIPFKDKLQINVCNRCGHVKRTANDVSKQIDRQVSGGQLSNSLCDLRKECKCSSNKIPGLRSKNCKHDCKYSLLVDASEMVSVSPQSSELSETNSSTSSPKSTQSPETQKSPRFSSMFELRDLKNENSVCFGLSPGGTNKDSLECLTSASGSLLRHKPVLDLSADNLDMTDETDSGVVIYETDRKSRERRSQSCDDITSCDKALPSPDGENFYSCTDVADTETQTGSHDTYTVSPSTKSHSVDDILNETENILIDSGLKNEGKTCRKEVRQAKVKSLSSSHDALSMFVCAENLDIKLENDGEKYPLISDGQFVSQVEESSENRLINPSSNLESKSVLCEREFDEKAPVPCDENLNSCDRMKSYSELEREELKDDKKQYLSCKMLMRDKKDMVSKSNGAICNRSRTLSERVERVPILSKKPPLPKKGHRKVLSVSDIKSHCDENSTDLRTNCNRYSMIEMSTKESDQKSKQNEKKSEQKLAVKSQSCDCINMPHILSSSKDNISSVKKTNRFVFDEEYIKKYALKPPDSQNKHVAIQKSVSSGNVQKESLDRQCSSNSSYSMFSLNRLSSQSYPDDVFQRLSSLSPPESVVSPPEKLLSLDGFIEFPDTNTDFPRFSDLPTFDEFPDSLGPEIDTVLKYDVCLGYLLHSVQCDNKIICFYSFQRNKQLMESVITPLAVLPGVIQKRSHDSKHGNTPKQQNKAKCVDLPNPAAPITSVPSEQLLHAGQVLRTVLLSRSPHMIRDRKFHLRTYRRCMVGTEMVDWLMQQCSLVHSRNQAVGMWQALVEEGVIVHVCHDHQFKDKYLFYRFQEDAEGVSTVPSNSLKRECEVELQEIFLLLAQIGPDAMMRMILRKLPHERTAEDLEIIYEELLHIKALSHLSTMVKRELASVLVFESHAKSGTVLFNQGDEGKSWYIILKGSVNVVIYGKGVVCTLHEGDDFGKLALVNDAPRAATIVLRDDNCHFLRVDKDDFNRILRDVEANTVRLKEHGQDVLVLEKIPSNTKSSDGTVHAHYKYSVMAGTPERMLEHLLESRLDNKKEDEIDGFLEDFILTHVIFMPCNHLCPVLLSHYHASCTETTDQEAFEFMFNHKKCVLHFVQEWGNIVGPAFREDHTINAFLEELHSCVLDDLVSYPSLRDDLVTLETVLQAQIHLLCQSIRGEEGKSKKRASGNFTLSRKPSKEMYHDQHYRKNTIKPTDENIFKVYCADHTYSTLKLSMNTTVENLLLNIQEKLGLGDDLILCEVKSSGEKIVFKENDLCVTSGLSINGRLFVTPREQLDALVKCTAHDLQNPGFFMGVSFGKSLQSHCLVRVKPRKHEYTPLPEQEGPTEGTFTTIEMFSSREMAYFITQYDWELFTSLQEYELIYQVFGRYKFQKITANLDLFLQRFNEIQFWVVTEMMLTTNLSKRVALLRKFIKLAAHCKEYKNLNSFFAVVMGLSNIAVSRLNQTWEKLPSKFRKMFLEFEALMDPSRNHRVYRLAVAKMTPPFLPFMPLLMKDMTFTHEGNKTYFDGLVNFEKMRMISQTLKTVRFCRRADMDIETPSSTKSADAMSYIRNLHVIDNQRLLTQLSHKLEPRKT